MKPKDQQYVLENIGKKSIQQIARDINTQEEAIREFLRQPEQGVSRGIQIDTVNVRKPSPVMENPKKNRTANFWLLSYILIMINLIVYIQVKDHRFLYYDDPPYVLNNLHIQKGISAESIRWAFTTNYTANWHPLTWLVYMIQWQSFGNNSGAFHLVNLLFHIANTLLCLFVFIILTNEIYLSLFVAALFAVHPMHVQSVAWISELKDVLSTFFALLSIFFYAKFTKNSTRRYFAFSIASFMLSLLSKQMYVTLPLILLLFDYWPLGRLDRRSFKKMIFEKTPYFVLALIASGLTYWAQKTGKAITSFEALCLDVRLLNALTSYFKYLVKFFYPVKLSVFCPLEGKVEPSVLLGSVIVIGILTAFAVISRRSKPYLLVGWLVYLVTLLPVIGIIQIGGQAMADRYTYFPYIGLFIMLAWSANGYFKKNHFHQLLFAGIGVLIILTLMVLTSQEVGRWRNSRTLWAQAVKNSLSNEIAYYQLGHGFDEENEYEKAAVFYKKSLEMDPRWAFIWNALGVALDNQGKTDEAIEVFKKITMDDSLEPRDSRGGAYYNLGLIYFNRGEKDKALSCFQKALAEPRAKDAPDSEQLLIQAHWALSATYFQSCDIVNAEMHANEILKINPQYVDAKMFLDKLQNLSGNTLEEKIKACKETNVGT